MDKENLKKYRDCKMTKLKKTYVKFISVGLALALTAGTAYGVKQHYDNDYSDIIMENASSNENNYSNNNDYNYVDGNDEIAFEIKTGEDPYIDGIYNDSKINIDDNSYKNFISYLNSSKTNYDYSDLYNINDAIKKYNNPRASTHTYDITNGSGYLSSDVLYNKVLENNEVVLNDNTNFNSSFYEKVSKKLIKKTCDVIVECVNKQISENPDIDKNEIFCNLNNLKILRHVASAACAFYSDDDILSVDEDNIEKYANFNPDIDDAFKDVIYHETMHIIQSGCVDNEKTNELELGICNKYSDLEVNPFYWSWFLEASAEKGMAKALNVKPHTYSAPIGYYDSIILCTILNQNVNVNDIEDICFEKRSGDLFKAFNAISNEEKEEIIKMMYSIEIMQAEPSDFYKLYNDKYGIDLLTNSNEKENLRLKLRVDILETMTKYFYKSLANHVATNDVSLNTIYYMINVYESDVFIHLFFNEKARIKSGVEFFDYYTDVQNNFFEMLSKSLNKPFDEVVDGFNKYSMNITFNGNKMKNYNLDSFGKEDAEFIEKKRLQNYNTGIPNIRTMPEYCKQNGYKK